ncbi:hypothetical protein GGI07_000241 [Coemansia sp. Benny D115]|nr:hypothetical protein GGI07_000241 [Coemansia sp. Benny D115]
MSSTGDEVDGEERYDLIMRLPYDLALMVARKLNRKELYKCSLVCRSWYKLFTDESIIFPMVQQMSHFDQEPIMYNTIPSGHEAPDAHTASGAEDGATGAGEEKRADDEDAEEDPVMAKRMLEDRANQQWLKNRRVILRMMQKQLNRDRRWSKGHPRTRMYLPPVPLDGSDSDLRDEWQGGVRTVKLKGSVVAALYMEGKSIRFWHLDNVYDEVKRRTNEYIETNRALLKAQTKYGGPKLPSFSEEDVDLLLRCSRSGLVTQPRLSVVRLRTPAKMFDYFVQSQILVTASDDGEIDVYDIATGRHKRTLRISGDEPIGSVHVWLDFVVVGHGPRISLWNHVTGEQLEDALVTAHMAAITGVFVLDNDAHLMSVDADGIMVVTDRKAARPAIDTLMDVPLYPMIMAGQMGAPYAMRLLHGTHLCVWGQHALGHYEVYEPGLRNLPPLTELVLTTPEGDPGGQASGEYEASDPRATLEQLEIMRSGMWAMYNGMAGDRSDSSPQGQRAERQRLNSVAPEQRYHLLNIDSPFDQNPAGTILCADFRRALFQRVSWIEIYDIDGKQEGRPVGAPMGLFPIEPDAAIALKPGPPAKAAAAPETPRTATEAGRRDVHLLEDGDEWVTEDENAGADESEVEIEEQEQMVEDMQRHVMDAFNGMLDPDMLNNEEIMRHIGIDLHQGHGHGEEGDDNAGIMDVDDNGLADAFDDELTPTPILQASDLNSSSSLAEIDTIVLQSILALRVSIDAPASFSAGRFGKERVAEARAFLGTHMPEIKAACEARVPLDAILMAAPYYTQKLYESTRFAEDPVVLTDHRGERTTAEKLGREMSRVFRVAGLHGAEEWAQSAAGLVPLGVTQLITTSTAICDSRVATGCTNGYVVQQQQQQRSTAASRRSRRGGRGVQQEANDTQSASSLGTAAANSGSARYSPYTTTVPPRSNTTRNPVAIPAAASSRASPLGTPSAPSPGPSALSVDSSVNDIVLAEAAQAANADPSNDEPQASSDAAGGATNSSITTTSMRLRLLREQAHAGNVLLARVVGRSVTMTIFSELERRNVEYRSSVQAGGDPPSILDFQINASGAMALHESVSNFILSVLEQQQRRQQSNRSAAMATAATTQDMDVSAGQSSGRGTEARDAATSAVPESAPAAATNATAAAAALAAVATAADMASISAGMASRTFFLPGSIEFVLNRYARDHGNDIIDTNETQANTEEPPATASAAAQQAGPATTAAPTPSADDIRRAAMRREQERMLRLLRVIADASRDDRSTLVVPLVSIRLRVDQSLIRTFGFDDAVEGTNEAQQSAQEQSVDTDDMDTSDVHGSDASSSSATRAAEQHTLFASALLGLLDGLGGVVPIISNRFGARRASSRPGAGNTSGDVQAAENNSNNNSNDGNSNSNIGSGSGSSGGGNQQTEREPASNTSAAPATPPGGNSVSPALAVFVTINYIRLGHPLLLPSVTYHMFPELFEDSNDENESATGNDGGNGIFSGNNYDLLMELSRIVGSVKPQTATQEMVDAKLKKYRFKGVPEDSVDGRSVAISIGEEEQQVYLVSAERCPVCLEDFAVDEELRVLECHHGLHTQCGDLWFTQGSNKCPICRTEAIALE